MDRRTYLGLVGAAATVAGCSSDGARTTRDPTDRGDTSPEPDDQSTTPESSRRPTPESSPRPTIHADYETTTVRVVSSGESLGSVTAAIADTPQRRYTGLSDTQRLPADRGMLFVYESVADRTFVMRRMSFGIDIVYADADRRITTIHHAPEPGPEEDGNDQRYPGRGQYVLELRYEWTREHGVTTGDQLLFSIP